MAIYLCGEHDCGSNFSFLCISHASNKNLRLGVFDAVVIVVIVVFVVFWCTGIKLSLT